MSIVRAGRGILDAARELDLRGIEGEIRRPVRLLVASGSSQDIETLLTSALLEWPGSPERGHIETLLLSSDTPPEVPRGVDLALVVATSNQPPDAPLLSVLAALRAYAVPTILLATPRSETRPAPWFSDVPSNRIVHAPLDDPEALVKGLMPALATLDRHQLSPLAYRFGPLRARIVEILIRDSSRANGQFALVSSLPSLVPVIGGIVASVADLFILTKNQVLLVFRIAGIYGRDVSDRVGVALEIAPVIGGAFLWRTVARSLVALLPGAISAVPKTLVAYVGTYVVGQMAHIYYREGKRASPEMMDRIRREGLALARRIFSRE